MTIPTQVVTLTESVFFPVYPLTTMRTVAKMRVSTNSNSTKSNNGSKITADSILIIVVIIETAKITRILTVLVVGVTM